ncbi:MAG: YegP family protein [Pyrinomonadaceae bacterium]
MPGKFEIKTAKNGKFHFNLKASNGQVLLSSEMYETRRAAESGVASVKKNSADPKRFDRKKSNKGDHYFNLKAANGEPIGKSEMYSSSRGLENGIASATQNAPGALVKVD